MGWVNGGQAGGLMGGKRVLSFGVVRRFVPLWDR